MLKMMFPPSFVSQEEFNIFHTIDRLLYTLLVINLWRDPVESIRVIALWLWLERVGFKNVVQKILSLPYILINELADDAVACLNIINNNQLASLSEGIDIPLMQSLMEGDLSLQFFYENRLIAAQGIVRIVNEVCMRALRDIMQHAIERNAAQSLADSQRQQAMSQTLQPMVLPGLSQMGFSPGNVGLPWTQENEVPPDDRTMFVTFSKGYPVYEWEVREFFTRAYGDCIESLHMQEVLPDEQSLFARIVCHSASAIEVILNGMSKTKFTINGKHVWARKFEPKRLKPSPTAPPMNLPVSFGF
ncbi:uncharacterized protein LOC111302566 [Durio zibethinus]|uniref:Uncharacterized protein LOC111302566 n=1 Tax=Durio zibethinus TaxID=66656 RepID=A0A6P5ZMV6_DURZI|nr:uncharacterized protein LOC111302566 [Durio zibethinus]